METPPNGNGEVYNPQGMLASGPSPTALMGSPGKPATSVVIQWLQENYESEEGSSLPRSTLYTHYLQFCAQTNLESINAASFGKLIRSVFPHLKTRRLGTRGHSKYHYYGIRLKPSSKLRVSSLPPKSKPPKKRELHSTGPPSFGPKQNLDAGPLSPSALNLGIPTGGDGPTTGGGMVGSKQLPDFGMPDRSKLPPSLRYEQVQTFMLMYRTHCQRLLDTTAWHSFADVEKLLRHFWQGMPPHFRPIIQAEPVIDIIVERDLLVYQSIIEQLLPDVLAVLPLSLSQTIRDFSRQFVQWLSFAMESLPPSLVERKLLVATDFAHTLRKQACLNHIAQSCRKVLQSPQHVSTMLLDWSRIDFSAIADQTSWLCHSAEDTTQSIQDDFKQFLQQRFGVEQWAQWLSEIVNRFLMKCPDLRQLALTSQQLLLKWSFYSSLIIRDLTIRNAPSLGSFHLLRTLFDSYLAYIVEQRLAAHEIRMSYLGDHSSSTSNHSTVQPPIPPPLAAAFPIQPELVGDGVGQADQMYTKYHHPLSSVLPHPSHHLSLQQQNQSQPRPPSSSPPVSLPTSSPLLPSPVIPPSLPNNNNGNSNSSNGNSPTTNSTSTASTNSQPTNNAPRLPPGKHYLPFVPSEETDRPTKQLRMDPLAHTQQSQPPQPLPSSAQSQPAPNHLSQTRPSPTSQTPETANLSSELMKPPQPPPQSVASSSQLSYPSVGDRMSFMGSGMIQSAGGYVLPKSSVGYGGIPPVGSFLGGPTESFSMGNGNSATMNAAVNAARKPSFGSFGSFSSEFSRSLFRSSFDRSRSSFERREGSIDQDSPWQHLFYNLSTPHISFQSFSLDTHEEPSAKELPPVNTSATTKIENAASSEK